VLLHSGPAAVVGVNQDQLTELDAEAEQIEQSGAEIRLRRLARDAALTPLDVELLMVALLPDLDSRFERLYGYLNDDVTRRRASLGLALQLAGASGLSAAARSRPESSRPRPGSGRAGAGALRAEGRG
jgi:winged helix domain-containing protein